MTKKILITGCSSGIGLAAAQQLQAAGYTVLATARRVEDLDALRAKGLLAFQLDLGDSNSIDQLYQALQPHLPDLYALINNAGFAIPGAIEDLTVDQLRQQFEINVFAPVELIQRLLPALSQQPSARIIQVSSIFGLVTPPFRGAYCASKYALESLSDALRHELSDTTVDISLVLPGPIISQFRANARKQFERHIALPRSRHQSSYRKLYQTSERVTPFSQPPSAVVKKILHALQAKRPKSRYYVTFPAYLLMILKRFTPTRWLDWVLRTWVN